jgi:hypothetical protein
MRFVAIVLAVFSLLLAALAILAPATLLDARLAHVTQGRLRLAAASGTWWRGSGALTDASGQWSIPVAWHVEPASLLRGAVALTLDAPGNSPAPRGKVTWRDGTLSLEGFALTIPAAALEGAVATRGMLAFGGDIVLDAPSFQWSGDHGTGRLTALWQNAHVAGSGAAADLGAMRFDLEARPERLAGHFTNTGGDVRVEGETSVTGASADVNATLTPMPSTPREVARVLAALGTPDSDGAVRVQWHGALR